MLRTSFVYDVKHLLHSIIICNDDGMSSVLVLSPPPSSGQEVMLVKRADELPDSYGQYR